MTAVTRLTGLTRDAHPHPVPGACRILVLNLMPNRAVTEEQLAAVIGATGIPAALTFCLPATHRIRHHAAWLNNAYTTFPEVADQTFDGLIITGAPLDQVPLTAVDYWSELQTILRWRRTHVRGSLFLCWGAYAAGVAEGVFTAAQRPDKITGVFTAGGWTMPQSRYFFISPPGVHQGRIVAATPALGAVIIRDEGASTTYVAGHFEYSANTLALEYYRDRARHGAAAPRPVHYFTGSDAYAWTWRSDAVRFYRRWLEQIGAGGTAARSHGPASSAAGAAADPSASILTWQGANIDDLLYALTPATTAVYLVDSPAQRVDVPGARAVLRHVRPDITVSVIPGDAQKGDLLQ